MSGVEMSTCEAMCVRTKFCVVSLYGCPCRMRLGWDCVSENMSTCQLIVMKLEFCVVKVYKCPCRTRLGWQLLVLTTCH